MIKECSDIIKKSLQRSAPNAVQMHKIEQHFIMDIDFDIIVNAIEEDLLVSGYHIIEKE